MVAQELRLACAEVAARARHVRIEHARIPAYAASLGDPPTAQAALLTGPERERETGYWLTLDAINFGSGWFPTLRKPPGHSGYGTVSGGLRRHFEARGPWSAPELAALSPADIAAVLEQDPAHELMARFAASLNDLGAQLTSSYGGDPLALVTAADHSAVLLVERVAGWPCFSDVSDYAGLRVPFAKRAQILAADLARSGAAALEDLDQLTMFADNLVPHVLRLDGILTFDPALVERIEAEALIEHGSAEEVEIRACAVQAVELIVAASRRAAADEPADHGAARRRPASASQIDELLWQRGQGHRYKASPRHRSRSTAY